MQCWPVSACDIWKHTQSAIVCPMFIPARLCSTCQSFPLFLIVFFCHLHHITRQAWILKTSNWEFRSAALGAVPVRWRTIARATTFIFQSRVCHLHFLYFVICLFYYSFSVQTQRTVSIAQPQTVVTFVCVSRHLFFGVISVFLPWVCP